MQTSSSEVQQKKAIKLPFDNCQQAYDCLVRKIDEVVAEKGGKAVFDESNTEHIRKVAEWLCDEKKKMLVMCGSVGNGKTTTMYAIMRLYNGARMTRQNGYVLEFDKVDGFDLDHATSQRIDEVKNTSLLAIDDIGCDNVVVKEYGNERVPFMEIIYKRYELNGITIMTTNLTPEMIRKRYGEKIADRLAETATIIPFTNPTYRRK